MSKEALKWSKTVAIEPSEILALPDEARDIVKAKVGVTPKVFVMNPSLTASYGEFDHEELKGKNWTEIFKKAKASVRTAISDGSFVEPKNVVKLTDTEVESWTSNGGSELKAKLVAVEDDSVFVFETAAGKTIRASTAQLSEDSVERARKLAAE